jgi:outer membrane lipoprotein SlyB
MLATTRFIPFTLALLLAACATVPEGPSVMALPGSGKGMDQFRADDAYCRDFALQMSGGKTANQNAADSGVRSAALGTVLGAAAGAAIGGERGAGVGAGTGLLMGGLAGTEAGERSSYGTQRRYDNAYIQCMYEKGDRVPVSGRMSQERSRAYTPPPPPTAPVPMSPPAPPMTTQPPVAASVIGSSQLFVYPKGGQSDAQIATDRRACATWASSQTGYDPARDPPGDPRHGDYQRAAAACLDAHGYTVR